MRALSTLALATLAAGCGGTAATDDMAVPADLAMPAPDLTAGPDLAMLPSVQVSGKVIDLTATAVAGATVTTVEFPMLTDTTDNAGDWKIAVPKNLVVTFTASAAGHPKMIEQPIKFLKNTGNFYLPLPTQQQYDTIQKAGGANGGGVIGVIVSDPNVCMTTGSTIVTSPPTGKVVYVAAADGGTPWAPDPNLTAAERGPLVNGYVTGAMGTVTPATLTQNMACNSDPYPYTYNSFYTIMGPITVQPGAYHDAQVFLP
jgi:hypothetical protein